MVKYVVMLFMFVGIVAGTLHKINQLATGNGLKVGLASLASFACKGHLEATPVSKRSLVTQGNFSLDMCLTLRSMV